MLIVGLGNPGEKYKNNRHNVGQMFIDYLNNKRRTNELKARKTDCFMNQSGDCVKRLIAHGKFKIENLIVVHDDLDIPLGKFKIQKGVGPKLHYGIQSIQQELGTEDFWRIRIGIDNRAALSEGSGSNGKINGEAYVLQDFTRDEKQIIEQTFPDIYNKLLIICPL